jgi:protein-disulfide isomerase
MSTAIVLAAVVLAAAAPLSAADLGADRSDVRVMVLNPTPASQFVRIEVLAVLESGEVAAGTASTSVPPGQSAVVEVPLPGDVREVVAVGMVLDDGVPF